MGHDNKNGELPRSIFTPIVIEIDSDYYEELKKVFDDYIQFLQKHRANSITENSEFDSKTIKEVEGICEDILCAIDLYFNGNIREATNIIRDILEKLIMLKGSNTDNDFSKFIVSDLDDSYSFRMVGRFPKKRLNFYRARVSKTLLSERKEMTHIPGKSRELTSTERFCIAGIPCLYLCVSTYGCWHELNCPSNSAFYCSSVDFNEEGKKLKILNLTVSFQLILGKNTGSNSNEEKQLVNDLIKLYPLILATSFRIKQENRKFKSEYVISQLIMHCLKDLSIDGVAYMSTKFDKGDNFPLNVCLALPVFDENDLDKKIILTEPMSMEKYVNLKEKSRTDDKMSYINNYYNGIKKKREENFKKYSLKNYPYVSEEIEYYLKSEYYHFDYYLVNQVHNHVKEETNHEP